MHSNNTNQSCNTTHRDKVCVSKQEATSLYHALLSHSKFLNDWLESMGSGEDSEDWDTIDTLKADIMLNNVLLAKYDKLRM